MSLDLTIAIPVKNEEKNLSDCLNAIGKGFAKSIVIIDSGSTDKTKEIARSNVVEVIDFGWDGKFQKKEIGFCAITPLQRNGFYSSMRMNI